MEKDLRQMKYPEGKRRSTAQSTVLSIMMTICEETGLPSSWQHCLSSSVQTIFGFVEPYAGPF